MQRITGPANLPRLACRWGLLAPAEGGGFMHALVIEDQYLIAVAIQDELHDLGYTSVEIVSREREAVEAARLRCPDLITADNELSDGTGVIAVQEICENQVIPVVFIVGDIDSVEPPVPFAAVVAKPFRGAELRNAIGEALVLARQQRAVEMSEAGRG